MVNKELKRREIALASKELFLQKGLKDLTVSEVAQKANIGKGTVYEYFANKEDIIFEILNILQIQHNLLKKAKIDLAKSTKEKITIFFDFYYSKEEIELREIYKEYLSIALSQPYNSMAGYHGECFKNYYEWFKEILAQGVCDNEIIPSSLELAKGFFVIGDGFLVSSCATLNIIDVKNDINGYIDAIFKLIEVKQ